jgi:hypothetical protein
MRCRTPTPLAVLVPPQAAMTIRLALVVSTSHGCISVSVCFTHQYYNHHT